MPDFTTPRAGTALLSLPPHIDAAAIVARLIADGLRVAVIGAEVTGADLILPPATDPEAAVHRVEQELGQISVLITAPGSPPRGRFADCSPSEWLAGVNTALFPAFALVRAATPALTRAGGGRIVLVGTGWSATDLPDATATAAVQGALIALVKTLARDLGPRGITVNEIALPPGVTSASRALAAAVGYLTGAHGEAMIGQVLTLGSGGEVRP